LQTDDRVIVGFDDADDGAVVRLDGDRYIVQTVDFFTPIVDDPYQFGQIAAANALSDIYAMGGTPSFALNIVGYPINELPKEMLSEILQGGADKAAEAGISIVGGHSVDDHEPKYGMVVTGEVQKDDLVRNNGAQPGDALVLTKPLGTGIISTAIKKGKANEELISNAVESMATLNKAAADAFKRSEIHAATDVTGFGLLGHLMEMCLASGVSAEIQYTSFPFFDGVHELAENDIIPGGTKRNLDFVNDDIAFDVELSETEKLMIADAQTSGGLLVSLPKETASNYIENVSQHQFFSPIIIGKITEKGSTQILIN
jgi:selenide,water dikinase